VIGWTSPRSGRRLAWLALQGLALLGLAPLVAVAAERAAPIEQLRDLTSQKDRVEFLLRQVDTKQSAALAIVDTLDHEAQSARDEATAAHKKAAAVAGKLKAAHEREAAIERERETVAKELGPRLLLRYRLRGASYLQALLLAPSVGDVLWRRKMLDRLLRSDLALIDQLAELQDNAREARAAVEAQKIALAESERAARERSEEAARRHKLQAAVVAGLQSEKGSYLRTMRELEKARDDTMKLIAALPPPPEGLGGFGNERGHLTWPCEGEVGVGFGRQVDPKFKTVMQQKGLDILAPAGSAVHAPFAAVVAFSGWFSGFGNLVILDHGEGYYTLYAHLQELKVQKGARVGEHDEIGSVGETGSLKGPYLYFEIRSGSKPLDPGDWLPDR
jgi:septal ring factor EnvC (AmiA/AmiB activator)